MEESMGNSFLAHTASIHILDDDSFFHIFSSYRQVLIDEDEDYEVRLAGGWAWYHERWWYKLAHVCQRWRNLILGSASYLGLCLVCTNGTPVVDMLAHSPPLPPVIDYNDESIDEDEEGIILALKQHDRVRRVRFSPGISVPTLRKFILAIDEEYPILEHLIMGPLMEDSMALMLPTIFHAPHLRHLTLSGFTLLIGSRLLTTAVNLVSFSLFINNPSTYFKPNTLLHWISFMPQLETLMIDFSFPIPNRDVERQLAHTPPIILPNLRYFGFHGVCPYLEEVVRRITAPRLEKLQIELFKQVTFSIPRLLQFMNTTENLKFDSAELEFFDERVLVKMYPRESETSAFSTRVYCWHLDWQVSSVAQIINGLSEMFSAVEHLTLEYEEHSQSSEAHNDVDRTEWREVLGSFRNVKTLHVDDGLVNGFSRCLRLDDGEHTLELLPELQDLTYSGGNNAGDAFASFIDARQNAGYPVTLIGFGKEPINAI